MCFFADLTESSLFLLLSLVELTTPSLLLLSDKFFLFSLDKIDRKQNDALRERRVKGGNDACKTSYLTKSMESTVFLLFSLADLNNPL